MQLDNRAIVRTTDDVAIDRFGAGSRVPIAGADAPSHSYETQRTRDRADAVVARTRIRREPGARMVAKCPAEGVRCRLQVPGDVVVRANRQFRWNVAMASHWVPPGRDLLHQPRILLGKPSHDEHRRRYAIETSVSRMPTAGSYPAPMLNIRATWKHPGVPAERSNAL